MIDDRVDARAFVRGQLAFGHLLSHHGQRIRRVGCGCQLRYVDGDRRVFPDWRNALKAKSQRHDVAAQPQLDCLPGQSLYFPEKESLDRQRGLVPRPLRTARVAPQESARFGGVVSFLPFAFAHGDALLSVTPDTAPRVPMAPAAASACWIALNRVLFLEISLMPLSRS